MTAATAAELVPADNLAELEQLDPATREIAVTGILAQARGWLAHAVEATGPREMADFKAYIATIAETTKQLNLSREIQLDAQEMVRRAERGVGVAIRAGQANDEIAKPGSIGANPRKGVYAGGGQPGDLRGGDLVRPTDFASQHDLSGSSHDKPGIYALADNVSDEDFEQAIADAKDEGNLSRANVVRKARNEPAKPSARPEHLRGMRHIDPKRVIGETVIAVEAIHFTLEILEDHHYQQLDPEDVAAWVSSLTDSIRSLNRLNRLLKELNQA